MRFNLGPLGQPGDPFGDDKEITVDLGEGPRARPEKLFKSGERDRFAGLGDGPEEVLRVPGDDAGEGSFRKGSDSGAQDGDFEDRGQIIESESLYRSSTGWEVRKRIVMSKSGRERTVVSCPGHLVVI